MSVIPGSVQFLSATAAQEDQATAQTAGGFVAVQAGLTGRVRLSPRTVLLVSASGQWASKNLYRSEKFSLGGPDGVRAYPVGEASGDLGLLVRGEARWTPEASGSWAHGLELGLFLDVGSVIINQRPWAGGSNDRTLAGAGVGVTYAPTDATMVRIEYAVPLHLQGSVPGESRLWFLLQSSM